MLEEEQINMESLNNQQLEAVRHVDGALLVLAGAGTGKTKVLTHRIAYLIKQAIAYPANILAVTFTNKAAKEMQTRINNIVSANGLNIGTFHSIAARMLRSHIALLELGLTTNFTVINQDEQVKLIKTIAIENNIDVKQYIPKALHNIISRWKDQGVAPDKVSESDFYSPMHKIASSIYAQYQKQMHNANIIDFGDIFLYCNQLLIRHPEILSYYQDRFKYILIDEYQDTNAVQYVWARMLASANKNICCVGDDDQSIYGWRGADVKNILRFEKDFPEAKIIKLEQNYRSTSYILNAAHHIISQNKDRHGKKLWTESQEGSKIRIISCWNDKEEARFIATEIDYYIRTGRFKANQIAILVRAGFQTRALEEIFISNALPYQIIGGLKFYERMEIRDILAYIRLAVNQQDNLALERIINVPRRSIGNVTLKKIKEYTSEHDLSVFQSVQEMLKNKQLKGKIADSLQNFTELISKYGQKYQSETAIEVTKDLLEESAYLAMLKAEKTEESRNRLENINEMLRAIAEFDDINEFVEHSSLIMDNEALESDFGGTVKIMTLHAAKGLEFDFVFLPGWEENIFPHQKSLSEEGDKGLEEERRIAYVGITRAKQDLCISYAESRRIFAEIVNSIPSRFLSEIPEELCVRTSSANKLNYMGSRHNFSMQVTTARKDEMAKKTNLAGSKRPGSRVSHSKFGSGIIVRRNGDNLEIVFEKIGLKTIRENFVEEL